MHCQSCAASACSAMIFGRCPARDATRVGVAFHATSFHVTSDALWGRPRHRRCKVPRRSPAMRAVIHKGETLCVPGRTTTAETLGQRARASSDCSDSGPCAPSLSSCCSSRHAPASNRKNRRSRQPRKCRRRWWRREPGMDLCAPVTANCMVVRAGGVSVRALSITVGGWMISAREWEARQSAAINIACVGSFFANQEVRWVRRQSSRAV